MCLVEAQCHQCLRLHSGRFSEDCEWNDAHLLYVYCESSSPCGRMSAEGVAMKSFRVSVVLFWGRRRLRMCLR